MRVSPILLLLPAALLLRPDVASAHPHRPRSSFLNVLITIDGDFKNSGRWSTSSDEPGKVVRMDPKYTGPAWRCSVDRDYSALHEAKPIVGYTIECSHPTGISFETSVACGSSFGRVTVGGLHQTLPDGSKYSVILNCHLH